MNKLLREGDVKDKFGRDARYRVELKGRKPIKKRINPRTGNEYSYSAFGSIVGGIANASEIDAYIYRR
jgi:hypothetical protein